MAFKSVLLTGGAGYVGTGLCDLLLRSGYNVRMMDALRFGGVPIIPFFAFPNFEFIHGDVRDGQLMGRALDGVDVIIHLAGIVGYPACRKDPELSREINVNATELLVKLASGRKVPILFASTGSTYGKMIEALCTETSPLNPLSDYGKQKAEAETIIAEHGEFVTFRFATAFGVAPRLRLDLLVNDFVYRALKEKSLIVYERHFMRTFVHVRDMALSFVFALANYERMRGQVYNVGDDKMNFSKEEICLLIKKRVDYYLHFADVGHDLDQRDYLVSYEKINNAGFKCSVNMADGIEELIRVCSVINVENQFYNV